MNENMRIDSHLHFWKYNPIRDSWIDDSMKVIRKDFLPEVLIGVFNENAVDACLAIQADQSEKETEFLLGLAKENSFIQGVIGWLDLCSGNIEERLEYFSQDEKFKGVRHIVQKEPEGFLSRADFQNGISKLSQFDLTYDILIYPHQLKEMIEMVSKFEHQTFILNHMAKPFIKKNELEEWKDDIRELARYTNVHCKISGMVTEADWNAWTYQDLEPYLDVVAGQFWNGPACCSGRTGLYAFLHLHTQLF